MSTGSCTGRHRLKPQGLALARFSFHLLFPEIPLNFGLARVCCPVCGRSVPQDVLHIQSRAAFDEELDNLQVTRSCGLVQRRCMRVPADRVVAVGILPGVKHHTDDLGMTEIGCDAERQVTVLNACAWKQSAGIVGVTQSRRDGQGHPCATAKQSVNRLQFMVQYGWQDDRVWISPVITEKID